MEKEIRAFYTEDTIRVYQAYNEGFAVLRGREYFSKEGIERDA